LSVVVVVAVSPSLARPKSREPRKKREKVSAAPTDYTWEPDTRQAAISEQIYLFFFYRERREREPSWIKFIH
jgi:hypothetical protein